MTRARRGSSGGRTWLVVAIVGCGFLVAGFGAFVNYRISRHQPIPIVGAAMEPTLLRGDLVLADTSAYSRAAPARGDVVVFRLPGEPGGVLVMRVVGLEGESVAIEGTTTRIDGRPLLEPYARFESVAEREDYGPQEVPAGELFVLGDNRDASSDSRSWGFVDRTTLLGRAVRIYLSMDRDKVRWDRVGRAIR